MIDELIDKFKGCMLGLALGDALGMPTEGLTAEQIKSSFGFVEDMKAAPPHHFHYGLGPGQFTDDTLQTLLLGESILESRGFNVDSFVNKLIEWGEEWSSNPKLGRGVGLTSRTAIGSLMQGNDWNESGSDIPTCGSAMRVAPIGLVYSSNLDLVFKYANLQSIPTHSSSEARAGSIAVAIGIAQSVNGLDKYSVLKSAFNFSKKIDDKFADQLMKIQDFLELSPTEAIKYIGTSPAAIEAVPAAFFCYLKFEPKHSLIFSANSGGDTDSIGAIAGALSGASSGTKWIPSQWLRSLEDKTKIEELAIELLKLKSDLHPASGNN